MRDYEINAIHENELEDFLKSIGIFEDIIKEEIKCCFCGEIITLNNFYSVFPKDENVLVCCEKTKCRMRLKRETNEKVVK